MTVPNTSDSIKNALSAFAIGDYMFTFLGYFGINAVTVGLNMIASKLTNKSLYLLGLKTVVASVNDTTKMNFIRIQNVASATYLKDSEARAYGH